MDNLMHKLIKGFVILAVSVVIFTGGYLSGYFLRGAAAIFAINDIIIYEKSTKDPVIRLQCARNVLQESLKHFYLLDSTEYLRIYKECELLLEGEKQEDK